MSAMRHGAVSPPVRSPRRLPPTTCRCKHLPYPEHEVVLIISSQPQPDHSKLARSRHQGRPVVHEHSFRLEEAPCTDRPCQ